MTTPEFHNALERTVKIEGGFVDHANDRGGATNLGVTFHTLERYHQLANLPAPTLDDLKNLDPGKAQLIYWALYWNERHLPCQQIAEWYEPLGWECFDSAVLHGPARSATILQQALNLLNYAGKLFPNMRVDGWAGPTTLAAMRAVGGRPHGKDLLYRTVNCEQYAFIRQIVLNDESQEDFIGGWILKRIQMEAT